MNPIQDFFAFKEDLKKGLTLRLERFKTGYGPGLVSVVLPFYNQAYLLGGSIESVFQQTYPNPELIVVNDGSTDEVERVLSPYRNHRLLPGLSSTPWIEPHSPSPCLVSPL